MSTITNLPTPPSRTRPTNFAAETDAFLSALATFVPEVNQVVSEVEANATTASNAATTATTKAGESATSAIEAAASASAAAASSGATLWVSGVSVTQWAVKVSPANGQSYRKITATGSTTIDPSIDPTNYVAITTEGKLTRVARSSNTTITSANIRNFISATGTWEQTYDPCSNLGSGWWCIYQNNGTGEITHNPNGSETIDGVTSFIMYPGESRLIQCDGSVLRSVIIKPFYHVFTSSGTFYKPPGYTAFEVHQWGAGGSGRKYSTASNKSGGGGGGCAMYRMMADKLSGSETVTIGDGGTAVTVDNTSGNPGGNTVFAGVTAYGGLGGAATEVKGGSVFRGDTGLQDPMGSSVIALYAGGYGTYNSGRSTVFGGGGGGGITSGDVLTTCSTIFGGAGGAASLAGNGGDGVAPGGGGGATKTGTRSGAGARGEVRIWGVV